ncbi:MAG: endo alpha-1,4 polygalactosaminidase [Arachnia sp.]
MKGTRTEAVSTQTWVAPPDADWEIRLDGAPAADSASVIEADPTEVADDFAAQVHDHGGYAVCYFNAGAWEQWRPDADSFPESLRGAELDGWAGEQWLDIRRLDELMPLLEARMDLCADRGFDAVDPDNVDGWANESGFDLTRADSLAFVDALIAAAHERGLAIGLKNAMGLLPDVGQRVDFAVNEECLVYDECGEYDSFLSSGRPVFHIEYSSDPEHVCSERPAEFRTVVKDLELGAGGVTCP